MKDMLYLISAYDTADSNENSWILGQSSHIDRWNRIEDPDIIPHNYK